MKKLTLAFHYSPGKIGIGFIVAHILETGEKRPIMCADWHAYFVETGIVSENAICGTVYVETELLAEFGFNVDVVKEVIA
jgi:hypothetical protein